ncbi:MAG: hypothetical protein ACI4WW_02780 [Candidatus Coprovivens sp.]
MNRYELKKKFNKFTKEEIIEGIFSDCYVVNIKQILNTIENYVNQKRIDDDLKECEIVTNNSNKAINDYVNYVKGLQQKYGEKISLGQLTKIEFDKLLEVTSAYEKANKEYDVFLEKI